MIGVPPIPEPSIPNRPRMRIFRTVLLSLIAFVLAGCGAPVKKAPPPPPVNRVGIISLLPSDLSYQKFGITKFNNETAKMFPNWLAVCRITLVIWT